LWPDSGQGRVQPGRLPRGLFVQTPGGRAMDNEPKPPALDRRELLGTVGAVAATGVLDQAVGAGPGAQAEDRASSIRITGLKAFPVGPKAYVKIETNHKITGWGEVTGLEPRVASVLAESL